MSSRGETPAVGDEVPGYEHTVSHLDVAWMAVALEDPNPIHVDQEVAQRAGFPSPIAHGTFPLGVIGVMLARWAGAGNVASMEVRLTAPTMPGDAVKAIGTVISVEHTRATVEVEAKTGDRVLARGTAEVEVP